MAKPKEDDQLDGLEINSIGSLYSGTWDKKYWSSSRVRFFHSLSLSNFVRFNSNLDRKSVV